MSVLHHAGVLQTDELAAMRPLKQKSMRKEPEPAASFLGSLLGLLSGCKLLLLRRSAVVHVEVWRTQLPVGSPAQDAGLQERT